MMWQACPKGSGVPISNAICATLQPTVTCYKQASWAAQLWYEVPKWGSLSSNSEEMKIENNQVYVVNFSNPRRTESLTTP